MINGSYILPLGRGWDLVGTAHIQWTPILPEYTIYIQIVLLLFALGFSLKRGYDIARTIYPDRGDAARSLIPVGIVCTAITIFFLRVFTG